VAGFLVNRVLGPYLDEALRMVAQGVDPNALDAALVAFGMPMGPCELLDEVGLDIAGHAGASLATAYGERMLASQALKPLVEAKELGKKSGMGIYRWHKQKGDRLTKAGLNPRLSARNGHTWKPEVLVDRCVLAMANEAVRCLAEGVIEGARMLDLATVFGTGFAPFRGGVLRYLDARGLTAVVQRLEELQSASAGEGERRGRFEPAALLVEKARANQKFHG
jgi:3-hydroxyacyl-CoA dehydrogenase/enoyl-CoA hydratase/3-hydroxybutyryl-CoA epimerase